MPEAGGGRKARRWPPASSSGSPDAHRSRPSHTQAAVNSQGASAYTGSTASTILGVYAAAQPLASRLASRIAACPAASRGPRLLLTCVRCTAAGCAGTPEAPTNFVATVGEGRLTIAFE